MSFFCLNSSVAFHFLQNKSLSPASCLQSPIILASHCLSNNLYCSFPLQLCSQHTELPGNPSNREMFLTLRILYWLFLLPRTNLSQIVSQPTSSSFFSKCHSINETYLDYHSPFTLFYLHNDCYHLYNLLYGQDYMYIHTCKNVLLFTFIFPSPRIMLAYSRHSINICAMHKLKSIPNRTEKDELKFQSAAIFT